MRNLFFILWFFLPAGMANMAPVFAAKLPVLKKWSYPMDGFKLIHGRRVLGDHKTIRGFIFGIVMAIAVCVLQYAIGHQWIGFYDSFPAYYTTANPALLGLLLGAGALIGDALKSGVKRYRNISSGKTWFPFDQIDYVLGALAFSALYVTLNATSYIILLFLGVLLHVAVNVIGYTIGVRDQII